MKKIIVPIIILAVILLGGGMWAWQSGLLRMSGGAGGQASSQPVENAESGVFEKGNPFTVEVNPVAGYKNPFSE
ncbi:MAG: hypothetical protein PHU56_03745 [Candidatus Pacebacteria bacterium]|nr:hypothetical protein [Candidatus Paceibacterota bacterium]